MKIQSKETVSRLNCLLGSEKIHYTPQDIGRLRLERIVSASLDQKSHSTSRPFFDYAQNQGKSLINQGFVRSESKERSKDFFKPSKDFRENFMAKTLEIEAVWCYNSICKMFF